MSDKQQDTGASTSRPGSREPSPDGLGPSGFDPSRGYWDLTDEQVRSVPWVTDEATPRWLVVKGTALVDPDVFVATEFGKEKPLWVLKNSGVVVGIKSLSVTAVRDWIHARPASAIEARSGETEGLDPKGESAVPKADAPASSPHPHNTGSPSA